MLASRTYETHQVIKKYISLGFSVEQSEGMVEESIKLFEKAQSDLATKSDLQEVKVELKSDLQAVRAELKEVEMRLEHKIEEVEMRLEHKIEKEIGSVMAEIGSVRAEINSVKYDILKWMIPMFLAIFIKLFF